MDTKPLVSVVLSTHERPRFLPQALACYEHQTYANRELIVVDDGAAFPVAAAAVTASGGRLLRCEAGTPLGAKLNLGLRQAEGSLCLKMDDDDWYAPDFLQTLVAAHLAQTVTRGVPCVTCLSPFVFFDVAHWELRHSLVTQWAGGTLLFDRDAWRERPFRPLYQAEDTWFLDDQFAAGLAVQRVKALKTYLVVRHRGHLWKRFSSGQPISEHMLEQPLYEHRPEDLLPPWALAFYRGLRAELKAMALQQSTLIRQVQ